MIVPPESHFPRFQRAARNTTRISQNPGTDEEPNTSATNHANKLKNQLSRVPSSIVGQIHHVAVRGKPWVSWTPGMPNPVPRWEMSHNMNIKVALFLQQKISGSYLKSK
jgi:hypothetical protein